MSSPFALTFHEALSSESFLANIRESSEAQIRAELGQNLGNAAKTSLALGKFVYERGKLFVELPKGATAADLMRANGRLVAQLKSVGGAAGPRLQVVGGSAKVAAGSAAVLLVVVEAAHMISAHDNSKRIKRIENRTKSLVAFHEAELVAELEACYRQAKEICLHSGAEQSDHDRALLTNLSQALFRIRSQWRHRVRYNLGEIDKASAAWWTGVVRWKREDSLIRSKEERSRRADESREMLQLMQFSLMLQFALSQRTGRAQSFIDHTLADEVEQWRELAAFTQSKGAEIFAGKAPDGFREFASGIESIAAYWDVLVARRNSYETTAADYAKQISRPVAEARKILNTQFETGHCERVKQGKQWIYVFTTSPKSN
jgi:hypothetical protein